jgi:hypothetical protein
MRHDIVVVVSNILLDLFIPLFLPSFHFSCPCSPLFLLSLAPVLAFVSLLLPSFPLTCYRFTFLAFVSLSWLSFHFPGFRFTFLAFVSLSWLSFHFPGFRFTFLAFVLRVLLSRCCGYCLGGGTIPQPNLNPFNPKPQHTYKTLKP